MNTHTHRTIYNHARGCLMVVAETTKSSGKASGESRSSTAQTRRKARFTWSLLGLQIAIALSLQAALVLPSSYAAPTSQSQQGLQASEHSTSNNSALSRSSYERYAPSQTGSGDESLRCALLHFATYTRPHLFAASQTAADQKKWERIDETQQRKLDNLTDSKDALLKTANTGTAEEKRAAAITFTKSLGEMVELRNEFVKTGDAEGLTAVNAMLGAAQTQANQAAGMIACGADEANCLATKQGLQNFAIGVGKGLLNTPTSFANLPMLAIDGYGNAVQAALGKPLTAITPKAPNVADCTGEVQCKGEFVGQAIGGAGAVKAVTKVGGLLDDAAAAEVNAQAAAKVKLELNTRVDDAQQYDQFRKTDSTKTGGEWQYPANGGAVQGTQQAVTLQPGQSLDRYGSTSGTYLSPTGTPYDARALPPGSQATGVNQYTVVKPFEVESSAIAPAFGQTGGGTQYRVLTPDGATIRVNVEYLLKNGYLK